MSESDKREEMIKAQEKEWQRKMQEMHDSFTPEEKAAIKRNAGKTVNELIDEWLTTPEGKAYMQEWREGQ